MKGEKGEGEGQTGRNPERGRGKGQKQGGRTGVHRGAPRSAPLLFKTTFKTKRVQITCFYGSLSRNPRKPGFGGAGRVWKRSKLPAQRVWMALQGLWAGPARLCTSPGRQTAGRPGAPGPDRRLGVSSYFCTLVSSLIPHYYRLKSLLRAGSPWFPPVSGGRGGGSVGLEKLWEEHSEGARAAKSQAGHSRERTWPRQAFLCLQTLSARALV